MACDGEFCNQKHCSGCRDSDDGYEVESKEDRQKREDEQRRLENQYANFIKAIIKGDLPTVKALHHYTFSLPYMYKGTPLYHAAAKGHTSIVEYLLSQDHSPFKTTDLGHSPLSIAASKGHLAVVSLLLGKHTDWDKNNFIFRLLSYTPLHFAATEGHLEIVKLLTANGFPVNQVNRHKESALHLAARNGHDAVVRHLVVKCGAKIDLKNSNGDTPLQVASEKLNGGAKELLRSVDYLTSINNIASLI